ncbi:unnamed protein product [Amoebophrya sp. A120]|nr:unnamed protein product [Amoebophrya sp. A120]|eukprot:GSA120T00015356001.1
MVFLRAAVQTTRRVFATVALPLSELVWTPRSTTAFAQQLQPALVGIPAAMPIMTEQKERFRASDGVRITYDPFAPGMVEKYGPPGNTDSEGFDPYADTVGPGIYGGRVKRDPNTGAVVIGKQYQNHNPRPGPVYAGGGYTPVSNALREAHTEKPTLRELLTKYPDLVNDISTGGAQPLHLCGMSRDAQDAVAVLVEFGADVEGLDTYGMTPLHRMASNNLPVGAEQLLAAGADPGFRGTVGATPAEIAHDSRAAAVLEVFAKWEEMKKKPTTSTAQAPSGSATTQLLDVLYQGPENGQYLRTSATEIPPGFGAVCKAKGWNTAQVWQELNDGADWFRHATNAYVYFNRKDGCWWLDASSGEGIWKVSGPAHSVPAHGWKPLQTRTALQPPMVRSFRNPEQANKQSSKNKADEL